MHSEKTISLQQYFKYIFVALIAFFSTIIAREIITIIILTEDSLIGYSISMILAYAIGVIINFSMQYVYTFRIDKSQGLWKKFFGFSMVAMVGGIVTVVSSLVLRYWFGVFNEFQEFSATGAFILGTVIASFITYGLNSYFVFKTACES
ncbi:MAG: GtrA family protein [Candidatus Thiodiazotropha sp. 6PLUC2]